MFLLEPLTVFIGIQEHKINVAGLNMFLLEPLTVFIGCPGT